MHGGGVLNSERQARKDIAPGPLRSAQVFQIGLNGSHEAQCNRTTISPIQHDMGIRDFLRIPRKHRRARSEARNEANTVEGRPVDLAALPHSQPDLGIGSSISPTSVPTTSQNREPSGT